MADSFSQGTPPFPPPPTPTTTPAAPVGARWVAALGAFLLVAAAGTFVAVRWGEIPPEAKLAALVAVTCLCLAAHRRLRSSLPVTAGALFHVGVLLVPIDVAAVGVQAEWTWDEMLLAQGLTATAVLGVAAHVERSVVLRLAAWVGVIMLAAGIGATTDLQAGPMLAGIALLAAATAPLWRDRARFDLDRAAAGWATLAGLAVPMAGADHLDWTGTGVLVDLGLAGDPVVPLTAVTGVVAGVALGIVGQRWRSAPVALLGIAVALVGVTTSWVGFDVSGSEPPGPQSLVAAAALFLLAEVAAWGRRSDPFWAVPTRIVAAVAEVLAAPVAVGLAGVVLFAPLGLGADPIAGLAAGVAGLGWAAAVARRPRDGHSAVAPWAAVAAAVTGVGAIAIATGSPLATAVTLTVMGTAVLFGPAAGTSTRPPTGHVSAVGLLGWAPVVAYQDAVGAAALGLAGALVLAEAAVRTARAGHQVPMEAARAPGEPASGAGPNPGPSPWAPIGATPASPAPAATIWTTPQVQLSTALLAYGALLPLALGAVALAVDELIAVAAVGATVGAWLVALLLDRATPHDAGTAQAVGRWVYRWLVSPRPRPESSTPARRTAVWDSLSFVPRVAAVLPLAAAPAMEPKHVAILGAVVTGLALLDALRLRQPLLAIGAGIGGPVAVVGMALASDSTLGQAGLGVTLVGVAWLGLAGTLPRRWTMAALANASIAAATGLGLTFDDPDYLATDLLVLGVGLAALGAVLTRAEVTVAGIGVATLGLWGHLVIADVRVSEPYLAPIALLLLAAGISGHRARRASSWVAFAPSVGLLGGTALLERLDGGPAWHALIAGAVGVLAVLAGGTWRLAGPLLLGTALVVAVTVHETLDTTAGLPLGVWLAAGGIVLLAAGVAMERRGVGPFESGRRLVDLIRERFV